MSLKSRQVVFALLIPLSALIIGSALFLTQHLFLNGKDEKISARIPNERNSKARGSISARVNISGEFESFKGSFSKSDARYSGFRGGNSLNIINSGYELSKKAEGLNEIFSIELGDGYAGAAIGHGALYVLDYIEGLGDSLRAFSLDDGKEIWRRSYSVKVKRNHGFSRSVPFVSDEAVISMGPKCHVMALDPISGDFLWGVDIVNEYGAQVPLWYSGQCPLVYDNCAVIAVCGDDTLFAGFDVQDGSTVWLTDNSRGLKMSHASVTVMTFFGERLFVYPSSDGLIAVYAEGEKRGDEAFFTDKWKHKVIAPSALQAGEDKLLVTAGYGAGSMLFNVRKGKDGSLSLMKAADFDKGDFACEQHTPIFYKGYLYTIMPKDAGKLRSEAVCMGRDGKLMWRSGKTNRFGLGPFMIAEGFLFIVSDDGTLTAAEATHEAWKPYYQTNMLGGKEAWAPIAYAQGRLYYRSSDELIGVDVSKGQHR